MRYRIITNSYTFKVQKREFFFFWRTIGGAWASLRDARDCIEWSKKRTKWREVERA